MQFHMHFKFNLYQTYIKYIYGFKFDVHVHTTHSYYHNFPRFHTTSMQLHDLLTKHCHKCSPEWLVFVNKVLNKMGNNTGRQFGLAVRC